MNVESSIQGFFSALPYFIVLIGVLIFIHEGGHFIFAKLFKVKVHVFSLGFGPRLIGFKRGETLYKISLVPLGGYVKMLGEDPTEEIHPEDQGRAFGDKPRWQRFLIVVGGPFMNIIFPLFLHFGVGLTFQEVIPAEVGLVLPNMPADNAGIQPGDIVVAVDGEPVHAFTDLLAAVSPRPNQKLKLVLRRGGETIEQELIPDAMEVPKMGIPVFLDEKETVGRIGVTLGYLPPLIGVSHPSSVAAQAGLVPFDLVTSVNGTPVPRFLDMEQKLVAAAGSTVTLAVRHLKPDAKPNFSPFSDQFTDQVDTVTLHLPDGLTSVGDLGLDRALDYVAYVTPGGAAEKIGLKRGDRLVSLDGETYPMGQIFVALSKHPEKSRVLAWQRNGEVFERSFKPKFIPAGEAGELGIGRDTYDNGFWGLAGERILPTAVPNPALVGGALKYALAETWGGIRLIGIGIKLLFQGKVSLRSLGGPIMIGQIAGQAGQQGPSTFFWMMALISLNLGILNLFPIPVLDGGQIVFILVEAITRRPISRIIKERVMLAGIAMILLLMVFATWNDIARLVVGLG
ncbi:MAG: RIP metalloprotease RseP [Myxococcota bacterium]|nr:RIP metalloprotease RseP [Myxococcota bacterium]